MCVCMFGFCNVWVCVCMCGLVMCRCVCVCVFFNIIFLQHVPLQRNTTCSDFLLGTIDCCSLLISFRFVQISLLSLCSLMSIAVFGSLWL